MSAQVRERLTSEERTRLARRRNSISLSGVEIVASAIAVTLLVASVGYYFMSTRPAKQQLQQLRLQLEQQKQVIAAGNTGVAPSGQSIQDQIKEALDSLETFKLEHLKPESPATIELFNHVNALARKSNLKLGEWHQYGS